MIEIPLDLAQRLLVFQYKDNPGYGKKACRSCGAEGFVDYGDHELPMKFTRESCSKNCPFYRLEQAMLASNDYKESIKEVRKY